MNPSLRFFSPRTWIYRVGVEVGGASGGPRGRGLAPGGWARTPPSWKGCGAPSVDSFASIFYIFQKYSPWSFRSFRELLFLHKNNTMAILLKTTSVRVSSIQIMQVRVQNKGKSVWKSRYDGDVSTDITRTLTRDWFYRRALHTGGWRVSVSDTSILHHAFISIFIALWAVITHYVTILMPILSYFTTFT